MNIESFYLIIAMLLAGASLVIGSISLMAGFKTDSVRPKLLFGFLALSLFIFLILPPIGFIVVDRAPYPASIILKRVFIYAYYILLPWFLEAYSGYKKKGVSISIGVLFLVSFFVMTREAQDSPLPIWLQISYVPFAMILFYGMAAALYQIKSLKKKKDGGWLLIAMSIYGILYFVSLVYELGNNYLGIKLGTKIFFPFHLQTVTFIGIVSVKVVRRLYEKYRLEKMLNWSDRRWDSLIQNMHLMIVELDKVGHIKYLNQHAVKTLGWKEDSELIGKDWFEYFSPREEKQARKTLYLDGIKNQMILSQNNSNIIAKNGSRRLINWTNVIVYDDNQQLKGTMSIGMDMTEQNEAFELVRSLKNELEKENVYLKGQQLLENIEDNIVGHSEAILYALHKARQVAPSNATVSIEGETGVGKELFANLIHKNSYRSNKPFVKINCAALPPDLMESEMFGHEKGAFTGAIQARKGRFELADGGTIFLDEIGELPVALQPKLLRVLQNGEFERVGGEKTIKVDVRIITATNRDLQEEVKAHRFREDLYYRLNVYPITIPALRSRKEDIPDIVSFLVKKISSEHNKRIENISKADMIRMTEYSWPGNIRELTNLIERSIISSMDGTLKLMWLNENRNKILDEPAPLAIEEIEKEHILKVLKACNWKINGSDGAAIKLGLNPNTLRSRLKKLNISRSEV